MTEIVAWDILALVFSVDPAHDKEFNLGDL